MKEFEYTIIDSLGIHARPAGLLVKLAASYKSQVIITKEGKEVNAKKILGVMSLGVKKNQTVTVKANGEDEDAAIEALSAFLKENL